MRSLKFALAAPTILAGVSALFLFAMPAQAGGCGYTPCEPPHPGEPVKHKTFKRRDVVEPGVYSVSRAPSVYGRVNRWAKVRRCEAERCVEERILLRPYKNIAHFHPPYLHRYRERVAVRPDRYYDFWDNLRDGIDSLF